MLLRADRLGPIELGAEIGRGGEGVVYAVLGYDDTVAKVYTQLPDADRVAKLRRMVALYEAEPGLADWCAWPQALLYDDDGQCQGFVMPRVHDCRPVHDLYSPEPRKAVFPQASWDFLVRTGANCARMFDSLHRHGVVVGDVNERNLLVGHDATVQLVDCDSFQLTEGEVVYRTGVGVADYTPPELQGADFRIAVRTPDHDRFGLAVVVFKLLFMGRHPFSGGPTGELAAAIKRFDYDYAVLCARMAHLVPLDAVSAEVAQLFGRAFGPTSVAPDMRPSPEAWLGALAGFEQELATCPRDPLHRHRQGTACIWCRIEGKLRYAYFAQARVELHAPTFSSDLERLRDLAQALAAVPPPLGPELYEPPPHLPLALAATTRAVAVEPPPDAPAWYVRVLGGLAALAGTASLAHDPAVTLAMVPGGVAIWAAGAVWQRRRARPWLQRVGRLQRELTALQAFEPEWRGQALRFRAQDRKLRAEFEQQAREYEALGAWRAQELARLEQGTVAPGVLQALGRIPLADAAVPGLAADRKRVLQVKGIVTAADVQRARLAAVPGLRPELIDALLAWRGDLEVQLGAPRRPAPTAAQLAAVDANCLLIQEDLAGLLHILVDEVAAATDAADSALTALAEQADRVAAAVLALAQAHLAESHGE